MKNFIPLSLANIQLFEVTVADKMSIGYDEQAKFDNRSHFYIEPDQIELAVLMHFVNERKFMNPLAPGIRSKISVNLVDNSDGSLIESTDMQVSIPKELDKIDVKVHIPFPYDKIVPGNEYKVFVRHETSKQIIGEKAFRMYTHDLLGCCEDECYRIEKAGIFPEDEKELHKDVYIENYSINRLHFEITSCLPLLFVPNPELEIRLYTPDGKIENTFLSPVCDEQAENRYHVDMEMFTHEGRRGVFYVELICMNYAISGFAFSSDGKNRTGAHEASGLYGLDTYTPEAAEALYHSYFAEDKEGASQTSLDDLVGLSEIKQRYSQYAALMQFCQLRKKNGLPFAAVPLHSLFLGGPGTGKTTVAKRMGQLLFQIGMLSKGHVVVRERSTLLGPNYSNEETNTLEALKQAEGGILFIDEAYQLYKPNDPKDPGLNVIETLMTALADESKRDWMLILAGYPDEMQRLIDRNIGLRSRIPKTNIFHFADYTEAELMEIALRYLYQNQYTLAPAASQALENRLHADYQQRDNHFGNARHVINLIQTEILPSMANRVVSLETASLQDLTEIQSCDIPLPDPTIKLSRTRIGFCA